MTQDKALKNIIYEILKIIEFDGNKESFSDEFISLVQASTIAELVEKITNDKKDALQQVSEKTKPQELVDLIISLVGIDEFEKCYQKNSILKLKEYFSEISNTISNQAKEKILKLILS